MELNGGRHGGVADQERKHRSGGDRNSKYIDVHHLAAVFEALIRGFEVCSRIVEQHIDRTAPRRARLAAWFI